MWESPEAHEKLKQIAALVSQTLKRLKLARARGTAADRAQMTGFGVELLVGVTEAFEIDRDFRNRIRVLAERWVAFQSDIRELNQMFGSVLVGLERLALLIRSLEFSVAPAV